MYLILSSSARFHHYHYLYGVMNPFYNLQRRLSIYPSNAIALQQSQRTPISSKHLSEVPNRAIYGVLLEPIHAQASVSLNKLLLFLISHNNWRVPRSDPDPRPLRPVCHHQTPHGTQAANVSAPREQNGTKRHFLCLPWTEGYHFAIVIDTYGIFRTSDDSVQN
jgi:hypothetical protein